MTDLIYFVILAIVEVLGITIITIINGSDSN
jgi:hypothetical protein